MKNCLLIGNGINRCYGGMSWEQLLNRIASNYLVSTDTVDSSSIAFEQLKCAVLSKNISVNSNNFAFDVIKELDNQKNQGYKQLLNSFLKLPIETILTTNYDYCIERSLIDDFEYENYKSCVIATRETVNSNKRHLHINNKRIFHIHGELGKKKSICLGNVHYAENMNTIMNLVLSHSEDNDNYCINNEVFKDELITWAQSFFRDSIFIVGLGLYDCDMDLWWLLSYRRQLMLEGDKRINNRIVYYYLYNGERNHSFIDCLRAMDVEVRELRVEKDNWECCYYRIAQNIKESIQETYKY